MNRFLFRIVLLSLACTLVIGGRPAQAISPTDKFQGVVTYVSPTGTQVVITAPLGDRVTLTITPTTIVVLDGKPATGLALYASWVATTKAGGTEPATAVYVPIVYAALTIKATTVVSKP